MSTKTADRHIGQTGNADRRESPAEQRAPAMTEISKDERWEPSRRDQRICAAAICRGNPACAVSDLPPSA
jgi:hypothetical protein